MGPRTRRSLLHQCAGAGALALAGCLDSIATDSADDVQNRDPQGDTTEGSPRWDEDNFLTDVTSLTTRIDGEFDPMEPILSYEENGSRHEQRLPYVVSEANVDALRFNREPPDRSEIEAFLREVDYDERSVVIAELDVSACYRLELLYVEIRSSQRLAPQFCRVMRDPSVECAVDDEQVQLTLIEVPIAFEAPPSGSGRGRSARCLLPPDHPGYEGPAVSEREATVTQPGGEAKADAETDARWNTDADAKLELELELEQNADGESRLLDLDTVPFVNRGGGE